MREPGLVPDAADVTLRLASEALITELFSRIDAGDIDQVIALYADDARFLGAVGTDAIRAALERGISQLRSRHVVANLRAHRVDDATVVAEYTVAAFTLEGTGPYSARSVLDQRQVQRLGTDGVLRIAEHAIFGLPGI